MVMYAVPLVLLALLGIVAFALLRGGFFRPAPSAGPALPRVTEGLLLLCDENVRYPVTAPDVEHEKGAVGLYQRRAGVRVEVRHGPAAELIDALRVQQAGDLFLAGDGYYIEQLRENGLLHATRPVARLVPVILVRSGNPLDIGGVSDLSDPDLRLAVAGERTGLMGRVTAEVLRKNAMDPRGLDNIRLTAGTASEAARAVVTDRADAAIVWRPVGIFYSRHTEMLGIAPENNVISQAEVAVLNTSENKERALQLADFLSGPAAREVFGSYGFDVEPLSSPEGGRRD